MVALSLLWIKVYPKHAEEYIADLEWLVGKDNPSWSAERKLHNTDIRISNHAIYPENWPECSACKVEPMVETMAAYYENKQPKVVRVA
jgi:hypothetical protein